MKRVKKKSIGRLFSLIVFSVMLFLMNGNHCCVADVNDDCVFAERVMEYDNKVAAGAEEAAEKVMEESAEPAEEAANEVEEVTKEAAEEVAENEYNRNNEEIEPVGSATTSSVGKSSETSETGKIENFSDLKGFSERVKNGETKLSAELTGDIVIKGEEVEEWTPIGTEGNPYTGEFDGDGYTITFPNVSYQLFDYVSEDANIHNLNVYYYDPIESAAKSSQEISSFEDLKNFSERVNKRKTKLNAKLTSDIEIGEGKEWTPIGTEGNPYTGEFDGGRCAITFPNASYRLFKSVKPDQARIYNLTVSYDNDYHEYYTSEDPWYDSAYDQSDYAPPPAGVQGDLNTYGDETIAGDTKEITKIDSSTFEDMQSSGKAPVQENDNKLSAEVDVSTDDGVQLSSKTSDTITPHVFVALFSLLGLSLVAFWMLHREKTK